MAITAEDLFQPKGDLLASDFEDAGIPLVTLDTWLTQYLTQALARPEVQASPDPDHAAAFWAYYRSTRVLATKMATRAASTSLSGITVSFSKEQILFWQQRSKEYLEQYHSLAVPPPPAAPPSHPTAFYPSSTPLIFAF